MVAQVGEDFSPSTSTCFSASRHKPVDILTTSAPSSRDSGMSSNIHPRKWSYWTLNSECNPGLHSIAKLALNSFYGKFGQHTNMSKMVYITHYEKLYDFLTDQTKIIKDFHVLNTGIVVMEYIHSRVSRARLQNKCHHHIHVQYLCMPQTVENYELIG